MRRAITVLITAMLLSVSANAYSQFVDPNRRGVSDDILRLDQKNVEKKETVTGKTIKPGQLNVPKKQHGAEKASRFEIKNESQDLMEIEFVEVGYNKETERLSLVLLFTSKLSARSVYVTRALAENNKLGVLPIETVCFSAPENKPVEVVLPVNAKVDFQSVNTMSFDVPFLGFGRVKLYDVPIKWL